MTVSSTLAKAGPYRADGIQKEFPFEFTVLSPSHLDIWVDGVLKEQGFHIEPNSVVFNEAPVKGSTVVILRNVPLTQETDLQNNTAFYPEVIENAFDKLTMIAQQIQERTDRSLLMPPGEDGKDLQEVLGVINAAEKSAGEAATAAGEAATAAGEAATAAEEVAKRAMGLAIGTIFPFPASTPPEGAYLLNGQTLANCVALYPKFWEWVTTAGVRSIDSETYEAELASTGVCGGFVVDPSAGSVRLPTVVNGTLWGADSAGIGQSLAAGLPNVTGSLRVTSIMGDASSIQSANGAFSTTTDLSGGTGHIQSSTGAFYQDVTLDASSANPIYGNSDTVHPPAIRVSWCIQVFNAATALSEQQSAQFASQMQTYLPLSGGTMTGSLKFAEGIIASSVNTLILGLYGGVDYKGGGGFYAYGKDHPSASGGIFVASAHDGTTNKTLVGRPNGTLTWAGKDITLGYPNYMAGVAIGSVTSYTATGDGWVRVYVNGNNPVWTLQVNGFSTHTFGGTQHDQTAVLIPVKKGDIVNFIHTEGTLVKTSWTFYPNR